MSLGNYAYNVTRNSITVVFRDGKDFTWPEGHGNFDSVRDAIKRGADEAEIRGLMDVAGQVKAKIEEAQPSIAGNVTVTRDGVFWKGTPIHMTVTDRIIEFNAEGFPIAPLVAFLDKLLNNQRREAVLSLYDFLDANKIPITDDGDFLVYKKVRQDYKDIHSGTFDNSVGQKPRVPHWEVDADRDNTCSKGLHVCARQYLPNFGSGGHNNGDRVVICKVNPADVVAVPRDYNNSKMRVAGYEVVGELNDQDKAAIFDTAKIVRHGDFAEDVTWGDNFQETEGYEEDDNDRLEDDFDDIENDLVDVEDDTPMDDDECPNCGDWSEGSELCEECEEELTAPDEPEEEPTPEPEPEQPTSWRERWLSKFKK